MKSVYTGKSIVKEVRILSFGAIFKNVVKYLLVCGYMLESLSQRRNGLNTVKFVTWTAVFEIQIRV